MYKRQLIEADITPIICVGESLSVRDGGTYLDFVTAQVRAAYAGMDAADAVRTVVAYEPVWAIGTGRTATPEQAEEVCAAIRATVSDMFGAEVAENLRVLYGLSLIHISSRTCSSPASSRPSAPPGAACYSCAPWPTCRGRRGG